jgi:tetratricopeptide (TPR) repeat protein
MRIEREAEVEMNRSGDGVRLAYVFSLYAHHAAFLREWGGDSTLAAHARTVMAATEREMSALVPRAGRLTATRLRLLRATRLLDNGELAASLQEWNGLVRLADSVGAPELQAHVWVRRGRTLVKLGRTAEAERNLLVGRGFARRANHLQWQYEAEHNLLHLHEATGRDAEARRAGEAFVSLTQRTGLKAVQLMAHHDLAWFHLRRAGRERARPHFEAVLAYTDSMEGYDFWAGEYFELTGDLDRAEAYYRRSGVESDARAYAGLVRLAEATGDLDRAIRYAHAYDETVESSGVPEFAPLLPGILARHGRLAEAVGELARARERAAGQGQAAAWATLSVELAQLELGLGNTNRATIIADSARGGSAGCRRPRWSAGRRGGWPGAGAHGWCGSKAGSGRTACRG